MTAAGVLLVDEDVRDMIREQLEKDLKQKFKDKLVDWRISGEKFSDVWSLENMPDKGQAPIIGEFKDGDEKQIGVAYFKMKFIIEDDGAGKYVIGELDSAHYIIFPNPKKWKEE